MTIHVTQADIDEGSFTNWHHFKVRDSQICPVVIALYRYINPNFQIELLGADGGEGEIEVCIFSDRTPLLQRNSWKPIYRFQLPKLARDLTVALEFGWRAAYPISFNLSAECFML